MTQIIGGLVACGLLLGLIFLVNRLDASKLWVKILVTLVLFMVLITVGFEIGKLIYPNP